MLSLRVYFINSGGVLKIRLGNSPSTLFSFYEFSVLFLDTSLPVLQISLFRTHAPNIPLRVTKRLKSDKSRGQGNDLFSQDTEVSYGGLAMS